MRMRYHPEHLIGDVENPEMPLALLANAMLRYLILLKSEWSLP
jgi:hypothetical protein